MEPATVYGCVPPWDPMLQANRPYADGSAAWPHRMALDFLKKQRDVG